LRDLAKSIGDPWDDMVDLSGTAYFPMVSSWITGFVVSDLDNYLKRLVSKGRAFAFSIFLWR